VPIVAYAGKLAGFWPLMHGFDISAHSSVSIGLALLFALSWSRIGVNPTYLNIIIPVMVIGIFWELGQFFFEPTWYISHLDAFKDVAVDFTGALIGATMVDIVKRG